MFPRVLKISIFICNLEKGVMYSVGTCVWSERILGCALFMRVCEVESLLFIIPATVSVWGDPLDLFVVKLLAVPKFLE